MKITKNKQLRVGPLVTAARVLHELADVAFINAVATIHDVEWSKVSPLDADFEFTIEGIAHGSASVVVYNGTIMCITFKQVTAHKVGLAYSEFYDSRHGNKELMLLVGSLLEAKLMPVLAAAL